MKTKKLFLLAAMMLTTMCATAQVKGDVNEDGKVDVADITAVIDIIQNNGGYSTGDSPYYLYVGREDPNTLDLNNIVTGSFIDFEMAPGWVNLSEVGITVDDNTKFDIYVEGTTSGKWYVACPKPLVSTDSNYTTVAAGLEKMTNNVITVKGHEYNVFTTWSESKQTSMWFTSINNVTDSAHIFK